MLKIQVRINYYKLLITHKANHIKKHFLFKQRGKSIDLDRYEVCFLIDISVKPDFGIFLDRHFCKT